MRAVDQVIYPVNPRHSLSWLMVPPLEKWEANIDGWLVAFWFFLLFFGAIRILFRLIKKKFEKWAHIHDPTRLIYLLE